MVYRSNVSPITDATFISNPSKHPNLSIIGPLTWFQHNGASIVMVSSLSNVDRNYSVIIPIFGFCPSLRIRPDLI